MTIQEMHDYFNLVQDKFNDPFFVDTEIDIFINRAQEKFVNNIIFRDILGEASIPKGVQAITGGLESTLQGDEVLNSLITVDKAVDSEVGGDKVLYSAISTALMHILSVGSSSTNAGNIAASAGLKFLRHNNVYSFLKNVFKAPSINKPYYKIGSDGLYLQPVTTTTENLVISYIDKPADVAIGTATDSELPEYTHEKIVAMALELAGVATESEALLAMQSV